MTRLRVQGVLRDWSHTCSSASASSRALDLARAMACCERASALEADAMRAASTERFSAGDMGRLGGMGGRTACTRGTMVFMFRVCCKSQRAWPSRGHAAATSGHLLDRKEVNGRGHGPLEGREAEQPAQSARRLHRVCCAHRTGTAVLRASKCSTTSGDLKQKGGGGGLPPYMEEIVVAWLMLQAADGLQGRHAQLKLQLHCQALHHAAITQPTWPNAAQQGLSVIPAVLSSQADATHLLLRLVTGLKSGRLQLLAKLLYLQPQSSQHAVPICQPGLWAVADLLRTAAQAPTRSS